MFSLFGVIMLHIWNIPDGITAKVIFCTELPIVRWVFSKWIPAWQSCLFASIRGMPLSWIELRNSDRVEIELVFVAFGEPKDSLISSGKSFVRVKTEVKTPNYSIS